MYICIIHCGSLWIKYRNRKRKKKEKLSQIRGLLAHQLNPFHFSVSLTATLDGFLQDPGAAILNTRSCAPCTDAQYSHTQVGLCADTESSVPSFPTAVGLGTSYLPPRDSAWWEGWVYFCMFSIYVLQRGLSPTADLLWPPQLALFPTSLTGLWYFFPSGCTSRSGAHPMSVPHSEQPQWCRTQCQALCSDTFLPTSPWVEQWFAQRGMPVIQSPGNHAQGFFQKLCQSSLQRHHTLKGPGPWSSVRTSKTTPCHSILCKEKIRLQPQMSHQGQLCKVQKIVV